MWPWVLRHVLTPGSLLTMNVSPSHCALAYIWTEDLARNIDPKVLGGGKWQSMVSLVPTSGEAVLFQLILSRP